MIFRLLSVCLFITLGLLPVSASAQVGALNYIYKVEHPSHGDIGIYSQTIAKNGDDTRIDSHLRVKVKVLGIPVFRKEADHIEIFRGHRLVSFESVIVTNGKRLVIEGKGNGKQFVVTTPEGVYKAPLDVSTSNPWSLARLIPDKGPLTKPGRGSIASISSGKIYPIEVTGGASEALTLGSKSQNLRHYRIKAGAVPDKWEVWFNDKSEPVRFKSIEDGSTVKFTLVSAPQ